MNPSTLKLSKLREEAKKFRARHGYKPYTMVPNSTFETEMKSTGMPKEFRVLAAIRRLSWGNLSDFAVDALPPVMPSDPKPQAVTQEGLMQYVGLSKTTIHEAVAILRKKGFLRPDKGSKELWPAEDLSSLESVNNFGVDSDSTNSDSPFIRFSNSLIKERPELLHTLTELENAVKASQEKEAVKQYLELCEHHKEEKKKVNRAILGAWRDKQRTQGESTEGTKGEDTRFGLQREAKAKTRIDKPVNPPVSNAAAETPFKPLKVREESASLIVSLPRSKREAGRQVEKTADLPTCHREKQVEKTPDLPTCHREILQAIPLELFQKLGDIPQGPLLQRIAAKLNGTPLPEFTAKIHKRISSITSFGLLERLAEDVTAAHYAAQERADQEKRPVAQESAEDHVAYWIQRWKAHPEERADIEWMYPELKPRLQA